MGEAARGAGERVLFRSVAPGRYRLAAATSAVYSGFLRHGERPNWVRTAVFEVTAETTSLQVGLPAGFPAGRH